MAHIVFAMKYLIRMYLLCGFESVNRLSIDSLGFTAVDKI